MTITARMSPELASRVDRLADRMGLTRSLMVERILRNSIGDIEAAADIVGMPGINALFRLSAAFEDDPAQAAELKRVLEALREHRRNRKQRPLFDEGAA